jgi:hydroxyacylglutathione hydrolase
MVGDDGTGKVAVFDPRPDCDIYIEYARRLGVAITHIFETHIHADFMSGSRALSAKLGGVPIHVSAIDSDYTFDVERIEDGQSFDFGSVVVRARHTPGHTPEHLSFELCDSSTPDKPWGVISGDSLFVGSAGRPDLLGEEQTEQLVEKLYQTLTGYYLNLDDHVILYPGHGKGSPCGPAIGQRLSSAIGQERRDNPFLQFDHEQAFKDAMLSGSPNVPTHFPRMKKLNAAGPADWQQIHPPQPMTPDQFQQQLDGDAVQLVDARSMFSFGGGHIAGAINLGMNKAEMSMFAGWMLDPDKPILLVVEHDWDIDRAVALLVRVGFTKFRGYLANGMIGWANEGRPLHRITQVSADQVAKQTDQIQVLDVRDNDEWNEGHLPEAEHFFFGDLREQTPDLDPARAVLTYCGTGYRASMAASILRRRGFVDVQNFAGSWDAWTSRDLPVSEEQVST